ncbi:hypothetical protein [Collimonas humicola]|uniref:hypothetical protein n=1 Tax=Collimonas humicola TaxID=2825886 RepID=UPI001B8BC663|nr:hypothetical protein [Collimonas humicola]
MASRDISRSKKFSSALGAITLILAAALAPAVKAQAQDKPPSPAALWSAPASTSPTVTEEHFNNG